MKKILTIDIEQDEDGVYVASFVGTQGIHTQAPNLTMLMDRIKELMLFIEEI